jgi:hypothetical protein
MATPEPARQVQVEPGRQPASPAELESYAERERTAQAQEKFEGGRVRHSDLITIVLLLVIVVLVLAII